MSTTTTTRAECETQVKAVSAAFKGFNDRREAEAFVLGGGETSIGSRGDKGAAGKPVPIRSAKRKTVDDDASAPAIIGAGSHKSKAVRANGAARAKDADVGLPAASARRSAGDHGGTRVIEAYTDGAAAGNGQVGSRAGWGVHWPEGAQDPTSDVAGLDESARLPGSLQTNNRAELMAIIRACQLCPDPAAQLRIYTDSRYSIQAMTEWQHNWRRNKWMRGTGSQRSAVMNKDLIRRLERELRARTLRPELVYVKGHASSVGNNEADRLAVAGAALPDVPESEWPTDLEPSDSSDDGHCGVGGNGSGSGAAGHGEKQVRERERARVLWEKAGFSREQASKRVESAIGIGSNSDGSGGSGGSVRYGNGDPASVNGVGRGK